ncbi:MAG: peptidase M23 family protein [Parcubacteria group bacterium Gr01-1014_33]|nr:MAG: peptidase M23 family protein [Parcubacteria group bacterium Gr01-1014_33]
MGGEDVRAVNAQSQSSAALALPLLGSEPHSPLTQDLEKEDTNSAPPLLVTQESALIALQNPMGTLASPSADQIITYTVQPGDTLGSIAEDFDISLNTLLWANDIRNPRAVKSGDTLIILPVTGVQYIVKKGDTIESIAKEFRGDAGEILQFNGLPVGAPLDVGDTIIIPDGEFASAIVPVPGKGQKPPKQPFKIVLPEFKGYFMRPVVGGRKSRGIHGYNGVDLANSCGSPVFASAGGTVIFARTSGWNGGYGKYAVITHPNGSQTLYAHMSAVYAVVGQKMAQGAQIGHIGSTGNSTGCHVHFEIRGARNPF